MICKFNGRGEPRTLPGRHETDCAGETCEGCLPCVEPHCVICRRAHADVTCAECVAATRDDLRTIAELCGALPAEAAHRGVNGEAMMLLAPSADPEAWRNRAMSAMRGRVDAAYLEDCRDEQHPTWVLGSWEQAWRDHLDQPTDLAATLPRLVDYLDRQMHVMAETEEVPFEDFARDLRGCRGHLEDVLHDGNQDETGAPCPACRDKGDESPRPLLLERSDKDPTGASDRWVCRRCKAWWSEADYRLRVGEDHIDHADELTAADMVARTRVPSGTLRRWASRTTRRIGGETVEFPPRLKPCGRSADGRKLYRVADVLALRDGEAEGAA